jgi:hypothetical protein
MHTEHNKKNLNVRAHDTSLTRTHIRYMPSPELGAQSSPVYTPQPQQQQANNVEPAFQDALALHQERQEGVQERPATSGAQNANYAMESPPHAQQGWTTLQQPQNMFQQQQHQQQQPPLQPQQLQEQPVQSWAHHHQPY